MIDLSNNIGRSIALTYRGMVKLVARRLEPFGIGTGQYPYLFTLYIKDGQTQQMLADTVDADKAGATRAIKKLMALGYVTKKQDAADRRAFRLHLTAKAHALRPKIEKAVGELLEELQSGLTPQERRIAPALLRKIMQAATNAGREERG